MTELPDGFRFASPEDAEALADLVVIASHGAAESYWAEDARPGQPARECGVELQAGRTRREEWIVYDPGSGPVAGIHGYPVTDLSPASEEATPLFAPVLRLEARAAPGWLIQVFATLPEYRRRGIGQCLLKIAEARASVCGQSRVCLVVGDGNTLALPVYLAAGFEEISREPMHPDDTQAPGNNWLLLSKPV